jgi:hypothetical protein
MTAVQGTSETPTLTERVALTRRSARLFLLVAGFVLAACTSAPALVDGLVIRGGASARFGSDISCHERASVGFVGFKSLTGFFEHRDGQAKFVVDLTVQRYHGPGRYPVIVTPTGAFPSVTGSYAEVDVSKVQVSPPDQQTWKALPDGSVIVTADDGGKTAHGTIDVKLDAAAEPAGFPPASPIHLTGIWTCPLQGLGGQTGASSELQITAGNTRTVLSGSGTVQVCHLANGTLLVALPSRATSDLVSNPDHQFPRAQNVSSKCFSAQGADPGGGVQGSGLAR